MGYLLTHLKNNKKEIILAPLFKLLEAVFELLIPLVVANIIDNGISAQNKSVIIYGFLLMAGLALLGIVSSITAQYFSAKASVALAGSIRESIFRKMHELPFSQIDKYGVSTLITRMTGDVNNIQNGANLFFRLVLRSPFVVIGAFVMAFVINKTVSLVFLGVILILSLIIVLILVLPIPVHNKIQEESDSMTSGIRDNLKGVRVLRVYNLVDKEKSKLEKISEKMYGYQMRSGNISALLNPLTFAVLNFGILIILIISSHYVNDGIFLVGSTVALYNYMSQILVEIIKVANLVISVSKAAASTRRVKDIELSEPDMVYPESSETGDSENEFAVEFDNVSFRYNDTSECVLDNISFRIKKGEKVGIIGGTASGKTTLINLLNRFYDVSEGLVLLDGIDVKKYSKNDIRKKFGYVLQKPGLLKGTIKSNIELGVQGGIDETDTIESIDMAEGRSILESRAEGIYAEVEQGGKNFSGGQRQRIAIARALSRMPEILLFDDSFSALDYVTEANLRKNLSNLNYDPTVIIVAQRISSVIGVDKIIVLDNGEIAGIGSHEELLNNCKEYREIFESQYGYIESIEGGMYEN